MAARWDIAAVIVALVAVFASVSPMAMPFLEKTFKRFCYLIWPARGRCRRFVWGDVQDGLLHFCDSRGCSHAILTTGLHDTMNCWDQTLGQVFSRSWNVMNTDAYGKKYTTKKPHQLALNDKYIQTDIQTLKAFLLLTADICQTCETMDAANLLKIQNLGGLVTIHLPTSGPMPSNAQFTKFEIDRIIEGFPPFYRAHFTTTGGITLPFPITNTNHIQRGAWVLSVGMTISSGPTPCLYNMQRISHEKMEVYWKGTHVLTSFHMIGRTLAQLEVYEDSQGGHLRSNPTKHLWCQDALTCFRMIMTSQYSSQPWALKKEQIETSDLFKSVMGDCPCYHTCIDRSEHSFTCGRNQHTRKDPAKALDKTQCVAALEIFNNYQHADRNLHTIWPVLPEVLQSVILGISEVEHYFSYKGQKLELPKDFVAHQYIYLRQCSKDIDEG